MRVRFVVALAVAASITAPIFVTAQDTDSPDRSELIVVGNGRVLAEPDRAAVELGVMRRAQTARAAQEGVNERVRSIVSALSDLGIERERIQTSRLQLHPVYRPGSRQDPGAPEIIAYEAGYSLVVQVSDINEVGTVIDLSLEAGANQLRGVRYELSEEAQFREMALAKAVEEAVAKAETLARAAGVQLAGMIEISEGVSPGRPIRPGGLQMMAVEGMQAETTVLPGELAVHASVTIRFALVPGSE